VTTAGAHEPTITVVVPLHNGAAFLGETLDSLAGQTVQPAEVIVVDDGSTDDGAELAARHSLSPRVVAQEQAGVAAARNRGALAARSRYVAFLDQDDLWLPWRHERLLSFLEQNPTCRALATTERSFFLARDRQALESLDEGLHRGANFPDVVDAVSLLGRGTRPEGAPTVAKTVTTAELLRATIAVTVSYVFERELFLVAGGCPTFARSLDDYLALLAVSRFTDIPVLDEPSVLYRIHPSSAAMSTSWPLPLLTALAAARFGGNLVPRGLERDPTELGSLGEFWRHQLFALARAGVDGLFDALALVRLLSTSSGERASLRRQLVKASVKARLARRKPGGEGAR
jgi:Glycosyl transferase family 2